MTIHRLFYDALQKMSDRNQITLKQALRSAIWAKDLTPEQMARVEADTFETFVPKGGYVCRKGDMVENWLGIIDGMVKMNNFSSDGKSVTFTGVPRGGWFGSRAADRG